MTKNASEIAKNSLIRPFEGYRRSAYVDPGTGGEPITVGEGTTRYRSAGIIKYGRTKVFLGDTLDAREAEDELDAEIEYIAKELDQLLTVELSDKQLAAMISFAYNMGVGGSMRQIQRLNEGALAEFVTFHRRYINPGTPAEPGLRRRREAELDLFAEGTPMEATWINLVRHTVKEAPEYRAYLMDGSVCLEIKVWKTREELLAILRGTQAENVSVGQEGWHVEPAAPAETVAVLTSKGFRRDKFLDLELDIAGEKFAVISGQPGAQSLRKPQDPRSYPGNMEPIPQGTYKIGDIAWAGGKDNYSAVHSAGLGPVWVPLSATFSDDRGSFGFHVDGGVPGSAGCVVVPNIAELKRLVAVLRKYDPKTLQVRWGL